MPPAHVLGDHLQNVAAMISGTSPKKQVKEHYIKPLSFVYTDEPELEPIRQVLPSNSKHSERWIEPKIKVHRVITNEQTALGGSSKRPTAEQYIPSHSFESLDFNSLADLVSIIGFYVNTDTNALMTLKQKYHIFSKIQEFLPSDDPRSSKMKVLCEALLKNIFLKESIMQHNVELQQSALFYLKQHNYKKKVAEMVKQLEMSKGTGARKIALKQLQEFHQKELEVIKMSVLKQLQSLKELIVVNPFKVLSKRQLPETMNLRNQILQSALKDIRQTAFKVLPKVYS